MMSSSSSSGSVSTRTGSTPTPPALNSAPEIVIAKPIIDLAVLQEEIDKFYARPLMPTPALDVKTPPSNLGPTCKFIDYDPELFEEFERKRKQREEEQSKSSNGRETPVFMRPPKRRKYTGPNLFPAKAIKPDYSLLVLNLVDIDEVRLPAFYTQTDCWIPIHAIQLKLLSRISHEIPKDLHQKYMMTSRRMTAMEAVTMNFLNTQITCMEYGCRIFSPCDQMVILESMELFYWNVKIYIIDRMIESFKDQMSFAHDYVQVLIYFVNHNQGLQIQKEAAMKNLDAVKLKIEQKKKQNDLKSEKPQEDSISTAIKDGINASISST